MKAEKNTKDMVQKEENETSTAFGFDMDTDEVSGFDSGKWAEEDGNKKDEQE